MATKFILSNGATLNYSSNGGANTPVGQLKSITFSGSAQSFEDITNLGSPGAYKEWAPTNLDGGKAQLAGVFNPADAGQLGLSAAFESQSLLQFIVLFPLVSGAAQQLQRTFSAYVAEKPSYTADTGKTVPYATSLQITGPIVDAMVAPAS